VFAFAVVEACLNHPIRTATGRSAHARVRARLRGALRSLRAPAPARPSLAQSLLTPRHGAGLHMAAIRAFVRSPCVLCAAGPACVALPRSKSQSGPTALQPCAPSPHCGHGAGSNPRPIHREAWHPLSGPGRAGCPAARRPAPQTACLLAQSPDQLRISAGAAPPSAPRGRRRPPCVHRGRQRARGWPSPGAPPGVEVAPPCPRPPLARPQHCKACRAPRLLGGSSPCRSPLAVVLCGAPAVGHGRLLVPPSSRCALCPTASLACAPYGSQGAGFG
jgi:hypothetical protein